MKLRDVLKKSDYLNPAKVYYIASIMFRKEFRKYVLITSAYNSAISYGVAFPALYYATGEPLISLGLSTSLFSALMISAINMMYMQIMILTRRGIKLRNKKLEKLLE